MEPRHLSTTSSQGSMPSSRRQVRTNCKILKFNKTPERKRKTSRYIQSSSRGREQLGNSNFKFEQSSRFAPEITHRSRIFSADDMGLRCEQYESKNEPVEETKDVPEQKTSPKHMTKLPGMPASFKKNLPFAALGADRPGLAALTEESANLASQIQTSKLATSIEVVATPVKMPTQRKKFETAAKGNRLLNQAEVEQI